MFPTKLSPDLARCLLCLPLNICAVAVYASSVTKPEAGVAPGVRWNPIWFGSSRGLQNPLHFTNANTKPTFPLPSWQTRIRETPPRWCLAQRDTTTFTLQRGLFLPYADSLSTSIRHWQRDSVLPPDLPTRPSLLATYTASMKYLSGSLRLDHQLCISPDSQRFNSSGVAGGSLKLPWRAISAEGPQNRR